MRRIFNGRFASACLLISSILLGHAALADERVRVEPAPAWTDALVIPQSKAERLDQTRGGIYYLLRDDQVQLTADGHTDFARVAYQVTERVGLEEGASVQAQFDPKTTIVAVNYVHIIRDGKVIDALNPKDIVVLRREQQLERGVFDGRLTAHIELKGLRVGDTIDYAMTYRIATPHWPGQFYSSEDMAWSVPLGVQRYRLIWPDDHPLHIRFSRSDVPSKVTQEANRKIYEWRLVDPEPVHGEDNVPNGFEIYNQLELSSVQSWPEISRWGYGLYNQPADLPDWFAGKIEAIKTNNADPADRITEATRLVQDTIRYVSISIGAGGYVPRPTATIVNDGFGDCKDKSTLLVAILKRLGVEAYPALTSSDDGFSLPARLSQPRQFDHMIVLVRYQGHDYWIDPTYSHQGGRFPHLWYPDYGYALPITEAGSELLPVIYPKGPDSTLSATEHFVLDPQSAGFSFTVDTIYSEDEADGIRTQIANDGREAFNKNAVDFYRKKYPGMTAASPTVIRDDRDLNQISVTEHYRFDAPADFFNKYTPYLPSYLRGFFRDLPGNRLYPYAINPRIRRHNVVLIDAPGVETVSYKDKEINSGAFEATRTATRAPNMLALAFDFRIKDRQVPVKDYEKFRADADDFDDITYPNISLKKAQANAAKQVTVTAEPQPDGDQAGRIIGIAVIAIAAVLVLLGARYGLRADREYADRAVYFPVSVSKFVIMNVTTFGLYGFFWIWKCWRWVRTHDDVRIWPFWRALFSVFWWGALFQNIRKRDLSIAPPQWVVAVSWVLYVVLSVSTNVPGTPEGVGIFSAILSGFCVLPMVVAVNRQNAADTTALNSNSRYNAWNAVALTIFAMALLMMALGMYMIHRRLLIGGVS